jgi:hypothetical protein
MATSRSIAPLPLPARLVELIDDGTWPSTHEQELAQNLLPLVTPAALQRVVPDEHRLYLLCPPFRSFRERIEAGSSYWNGPDAALDQVDPDRALDIGDFGLGSDTVLALDYRGSDTEPVVIRLQWRDAAAGGNRWVTVAPSFAEFWLRLTGT